MLQIDLGSPLGKAEKHEVHDANEPRGGLQIDLGEPLEEEAGAHEVVPAPGTPDQQGPDDDAPPPPQKRFKKGDAKHIENARKFRIKRVAERRLQKEKAKNRKLEQALTTIVTAMPAAAGIVGRSLQRIGRKKL